MREKGGLVETGLTGPVATALKKDMIPSFFTHMYWDYIAKTSGIYLVDPCVLLDIL